MRTRATVHTAGSAPATAGEAVAARPPAHRCRDAANGQAGDDVLLGEAGIDRVNGNAGLDTVSGAGNDESVVPNDTVLGETIDDAFIFDASWVNS